MFRDREKELDRLNRQLLEDEEETEEAEEQEYDEDQEQSDYDAYNGDTADVDMEDYSDRVYNEPKRGCGLAVFLLLCAAALLILAYVLAKKEGLI